jgi:pyruvate formate lyase activating enzyme
LEKGASMKEAILYKKLPAKKVHCNVCQRQCIIPKDKVGYCGTRLNENGKLYTLIYEVVSALYVDPIEKKPLFHFFPGSQALSLGTLGCNFRCIHCQNWEISYAQIDPHKKQLDSHTLTPQEVVSLAKKYNAQGIAWTYNEPTIWLEYTIDCAKLAKKAGLYTAYITNGFITPEALDLIGPYLDAFRVDLKTMNKNICRELTHMKDFENILAVSKRAKEKWNMHVEFVTNIIPNYNDSEKELEKIASWIKNELGPDTPWHVTRFYPAAQLDNIPPTPIKVLERARQIGMDSGLSFVYIGNVGAHKGENTYCPRCKQLVIERTGYFTKMIGVEKGKCKFCKCDLNIVDTPRKVPKIKMAKKKISRTKISTKKPKTKKTKKQ